MFKKVIWLLFLALVVPAQGANIIFQASGDAGVADWQSLLESAGHTVTYRTDLNTLDDEKIAAINAADLVIISRNTNSIDYSNDDTERLQWHSFATPIMLCNGYILRASRWQWAVGEGLVGLGATSNMSILVNHSVFAGVGGANDSVVMLTGGSSHTTSDTDAGNGQVLATTPGGNPWIAYWEPGVVFNASTTDVPGGPRMFFAAGSSTNGDFTQGDMNLTEDGQTLFLNAVTFLTGGGSDPGIASGPSPGNGATDVLRDTVLTWEPGELAGSHKVYFGNDLDDVNSGTEANVDVYKGPKELDDTSYDPGRMEFGKTYFWRIDEVNEAPDNTVFKGNVWSFEVEPEGIQVTQLTATASSQYSAGEDPNNTINGVGLYEDGSHDTDRTTMWLCASSDPGPWIRYDLSEPRKLSEMLVWNHNTQSEEDLGYGIMEAQISVSRDGIDFTDFGIVTLAQSAETSVDLRGVVAQAVKITVVSNYGGSKSGLSEVRLYAIPTAAREMKPVDGAINVDPATAVLTWRAGREAGSHDVYLSTDEQAVIDGTAPKVTTTAVSTVPNLDLATTYYWRVDEVNNVEDPALWAGSVLSFSTAGSIVVDNMESYKNQAGLFIYEAWVDGYQKSDNGSLVGVGANFEAEKTIVHGGSQSLPMAYGDLGITDSWATLTLPAANWSKHGVKSLSLYFHGMTTNSAGQLYVKVNNTKFEYKGAATDILTDQWFPFTIDLTGVTTVNSLTIGVAGGAGMLLVDDIRLYPQASELVTPVAPDAANLQAVYLFEGNFNDSSGKGNHGTALVNAVTLNDPTRGQVLDLDGSSGVSVPLISLSDEVTITAWINVLTLGSNINSVFMNFWDANGVHTRIQNSHVNLGHNPLGNLAGTSDVVIDEWNFVSYTVKNTATETTRAIYLNGVGEVSATDAIDPEVGPRATYVGNGTIGAWDNSGTLQRFLIGMIDDVVIYDRALSAGEIAALAGRTAPLYKAF